MLGKTIRLNTEPNGSISISNDRSSITIQPDGTIAISSQDPIQLTGASMAKLDQAGVDGATTKRVLEALASRIEKKR